MQINAIGITNFKANYHTVEKKGRYFEHSKISTDNEEKLGKEPVLEYQCSVQKFEFPMSYDGKYYTTPVYKNAIDNYRIFYKDTGKYERRGEVQKINPLFFARTAMREDFKYNGLPLEYAVAKGSTAGKVFVNTTDVPKDIPVILILDYVKREEDIISNVPDNVIGLITSMGDFGVLSHCANLTRNQFHVFSVVLDENKYNDLKKQEGKYISVNNENGIIEYEETQPNTKQTETVEKVKVPILEKVDRLLNFDELTPQNCGNKGYRLGIMQRLAKEGVLKDITIPNGFVIPAEYINKFNKYINVEDIEEERNRIDEGVYTKDTENRIKELGLPRRNLIIRSNFNTEDLGSFSSAGIYESQEAGKSGSIMLDASDLVKYSLDSECNPLSKRIHEKYGISDGDVQPSVIVQERIKNDYSFTAYSDDGNNNIIIDFADFRLGLLKPATALIKFNKNTKELSVERKQSPFASYTLDEKGNIIDQYHEKDKLDSEWEFLKPLLGIVSTGALVLENFFKHPQDIEGGIKDGKVYFWQTRDIVAKAVKRI